MARKQPPSGASDWLSSADELPRETQIVYKDRQRRQWWYRLAIKGAVFSIPVIAILLIIVFGSMSRPAAVTATESVNTESRSAATIAVRSWLSANPSPVPGTGSIVSWNNAVRVKKPVQSDQDAKRNPLPAYDTDVQNFTVVDGNGQTYSVDVQVAVDPKTGSHVIGTPSLAPIPGDPAQAPTGAPWIGLHSVGAPAAVTTAVNAWAEAYTSGKADTLAQAVGDSDPKDTFVPLGGVKSHSISITSAAWLPTADEAKAGAVTSDLMVARVNLSVVYLGQTPPTHDNPGTFISYDLLIKKANTAAPVVVAWVGPGLGTTAKEYTNAVRDRVATTIVPNQQNTGN